MGKCRSCSEGKCEGKYERRNYCDDPRNCTCTCQENAGDTFSKGFFSVLGGVAAFAGGVVLTVSTGGLGAVGIAAVIGGGALTGAGATMAIQPVAKKINGERMTGKDYVKDVVIGGTIGAVTGPIGMGGASVTTSIASKVGTEGVKQGAVKLGCRAAVGAVSGAASSAIQEGANGQFNVGNVLKGSLLGAATGGAAHLSGNVVNKVAETGVIRSVTKVAADTTSAVVIDASSQKICNGQVDLKKLALNAGARAATSAASEAATNATYKAHGGKDALMEKKLESTNHEVDSKTEYLVEKAAQLAQDYQSGKISKEEYYKKWNQIEKTYKDLNKLYSQKNWNGGLKGGSREAVAGPGDKFRNVIDKIRKRMDQDAANRQSPEDIQFKKTSFHEIHTNFNELISNGYSAAFGPDGTSLVFTSHDGSSSVKIEKKVIDYLDVNSQLINQQIPPDPSKPTILSAQFDQQLNLVLSPHQWNNDANVIYGNRCRICPTKLNPDTVDANKVLSKIGNPPAKSEIGAGHVNYVGQTTRPINERYGEHAASVANQINNKETQIRPMYEHVADHFQNGDLPSGTRPQDAFRQGMDMIRLPTGPIGDKAELRSWEVVWQFVLDPRRALWGWSQR